MISNDLANYRIIFYPNKIVLRGECRSIHAEAQRILMRFQYSARPYHVTLDTNELIELSTSN